jgi:hypothetical protein
VGNLIKNKFPTRFYKETPKIYLNPREGTSIPNDPLFSNILFLLEKGFPEERDIHHLERIIPIKEPYPNSARNSSISSTPGGSWNLRYMS